jgi:hypothetical protein
MTAPRINSTEHRTAQAEAERFAEAVDSIRQQPRPIFKCGNCGQTFATKGEKRRHKLTCAPGSAQVQPIGDEDWIDPADLYGRTRISPEIKARAAAEWAAMDEFGRLPAGWSDQFADAGNMITGGR